MKLIAVAIIALLPSLTLAAQPVPMPERGGSCPHGFTHSGGFCVPSARAHDV